MLSFTVSVVLALALVIGLAGCAKDKSSLEKDTTPPATPSNLATACGLNGSTPTLTWNAATDAGSGIASYLARTDAGDWIDVGNVTIYTYATPLTSGNHTFELRAKDRAGNMSSAASVTFTTRQLDSSKIVRYERQDLANGVDVTVPPSGIAIVPIDITSEYGDYSVDITVNVTEGGTEQDIDFLATNQCGYVRIEPRRTSYSSTLQTWESYTYYLYLSNEFCSTHNKVVHLSATWQKSWPVTTVDAANLELQIAEASVKVCMGYAGAGQIDDAVEDWDGSSGLVKCTWGSTAFDAADHVRGTFNATYDVAQDGTITAGHSISWTGIKWNSTTGKWVSN